MKRSRRAHLGALLALGAIAAGSAGMGATYAAFSGETSAAGNVIVAAPDFRGPTVADVIVAKSAGGAPGGVRPGQSYRVYANVSDVGSPASGVSTVTSNVSQITAGQVAAPLTAGSWTVNGQTYNRRSASLTAGASTGTKSFSVTATDMALNTTVANGTAVVDGTGASAVDIQTTNGSVAGRPQVGDTITFTFSEGMDPNSIMPGWTGGALTVVAGFVTNSTADQFQVWDTDISTQARFGTVSMGRTDFTTGNLAFMSSTMTMSGSTVTVTLGGSIMGTVTTVGGTGTMRWTPSATATDIAGNAMSTTALNEPGAADRDF